MFFLPRGWIGFSFLNDHRLPFFTFLVLTEENVERIKEGRKGKEWGKSVNYSLYFLACLPFCGILSWLISTSLASPFPQTPFLWAFFDLRKIPFLTSCFTQHIIGKTWLCSWFHVSFELGEKLSSEQIANNLLVFSIELFPRQLHQPQSWSYLPFSLLFF